MHVLCVIVFIVFTIPSLDCVSKIKVSYEDFKKLPPIFQIDDYEKCKTEGKLFCKVSIILLPVDSKNSSYYWKIVEWSVDDYSKYNHNELFHAICVNDFCPRAAAASSDTKSVFHNILSSCYTRKYQNLGLEAFVKDSSCTIRDDIYQADAVDFVWLFSLLLYTLYVVFATAWDYRIQHGYLSTKAPYFRNYYVDVFIISFSILNSWKKLRENSTRHDTQKLKCIQGIRFYNMLLIIFFHTYSSYMGGYVENTEYIENIPNNPVKLGITNLFVFLVQTFFLLSAFFLSYHLFQVMSCSKDFKGKYIIFMFLNRCLRIVPSVLFVLGIGCTIWIISLFYGPIKDLYSDLEYQRCKKNWWTILFFINNHYNENDMCFFTIWYLAADTQLYLVSLLIISIIWKFKHRTKQILMTSVLIGIIIPMAVSYIYSLDIIYRITPENIKNNQFRSFNFNALYSSTYANMATYMVGIYLGYVYFKNETGNLNQSWLVQLFWFIMFLGLPTLVIVTSSYYYNRFFSAILCGILKPTYALGIGIGILGMTNKIGGPIKSVCEWNVAVFMGNLAFSTYVFHYGIVFYRTATAKQPLYISDFVLVTSFLRDAFLSFLCGFFVHIFVELPALQLQNKLMPRVKRHRPSNNGKNM